MAPALPRLALLVALALAGGAAQASTLTLSDVSSDETDAAVLAATLEFQITGASELTLSVTNDTTAPAAYVINEIFFNATSNVSALSLVSASSSLDGSVGANWGLATGVAGNGFGRFDFQLFGKSGPFERREIQPGETVDFVLSIAGTGPFSLADFTTDLSVIPPGQLRVLAAAKFVKGPKDDSAYGAVVPEPTSAALLGLGLAAIAASRRRPGRA